MLSIVSGIFSSVTKIFAIGMTVYTVVKIKNDELESEEDQTEDEMLEEAKEEMREVIRDEIEEGYLPRWSEIFLDSFLEGIILRLLAKLANEKGFFEQVGDSLGL